MMAIQITLILGLVLLLVLYLIRFRSSLYLRILALLIAVTGIGFVYRPEWSILVSKTLGVGRGADLISYLGLLGLSFVCLQLYSKLRSLDSDMVRIVRLLAIEKAGLHPMANKPTVAPSSK